MKGIRGTSKQTVKEARKFLVSIQRNTNIKIIPSYIKTGLSASEHNKVVCYSDKTDCIYIDYRFGCSVQRFYFYGEKSEILKLILDTGNKLDIPVVMK